MRPAGTTEATIYRSTSRTSLPGALRELYQYREVVRTFALRSFRVRYRQAVFGVAWAVLQPVALLALFFVFFRRTEPATTGHAYVRATFGGLVIWQLVSGAVTAATSSLVDDASLMRKVYFPRECPVLGAVIAALPDHLINLCLLLVVGFAYGMPATPWLLAVPALSAVALVTVLGAALPLAGMYVYYRDFRYALPLGVQLWLLASPVAYSASTHTHGRWRDVYAIANPLVGPIESIRNIVGRGAPPSWRLIGLGVVPSTVLLLVGYSVFKRIETQFADVV